MMLKKLFASLVVVAILSLISSPAGAEILCQRKNVLPNLKYQTRVQSVIFIKDGMKCPKGFRAIGNFINQSDAQQVAKKVFDEQVIELAKQAAVVGPRGVDGINGAKGDQGERGEQGLVGDKGDKGERGDKGDQGDRGEAGIAGAKGDSGERGEQGFTGIKGDKGDQGQRGEDGNSGAKGDQGERGEQGFMGAQGATGTQGLRGEKGDKGDQGLVGPQGPVGPQGAQGIDGKDSSRPGDAPIAVKFVSSEGSDCQQIDLAEYCADEDGCAIRVIYNDKKHSTRKIYESLLTIDETPSSKDGLAFNRVATAFSDGTKSVSGYLSGDSKHMVWEVGTKSVLITNYLPKECGNKEDGAPYSGSLLNISVADGFEASITIFDN